MDTAFFDLFRELKMDDNMNTVLRNSVVNKVATNRNHNVMRIYMTSDTVIPKRRIWKLEDAIKKQYFAKDNMDVHIIEHFNLSDQYTPESLYNNYKDSILEEFSQYDVILFSLLKRGDFRFRDRELIVVLENTVIAHECEMKLHDLLNRIFCERCGLTMSISFEYKDCVETRYRQDADQKIINEIAAIEERCDQLAKQKELLEEEPAEDKSKFMKTSGKGGSFDAGDGDATKKKTVPGNENKGGFARRSFGVKRSSNPDTIYGRDFEDAPMSISEIFDGIGEVVVRGQIISMDQTPLKKIEKTIVSFVITDFTDSIKAKLFVPNEQLEEFLQNLKVGGFYQLKGTPAFDTWDKELTFASVFGMMKSVDTRTPRMDNAPEKRVELHCHTKMSDMDGVSEVSDIIKQAMKWGHKALAITDHGVVQSFPDAAHTVSGDFKVIYGVEGYLVDDTKLIVQNSKHQSLDDTYVVFDIETTGLNAKKVKIIEIGAVKVQNGEIIDRFSVFIDPEEPLPYDIVNLTHITDDMLRGQEKIDTILPKFMEFCGDSILVAHNADFDTGCILAQCQKLGIKWDFTYVDTVPLAKFLLPSLKNYKLDTVGAAMNVSLDNHHRAVEDAECTAQFFVKFLADLKSRGIEDLDTLNEETRMNEERIRKERPYHIIILAKNDIGRINLYRLVSASHLKYFRRQPKIPKSLIEKYREGLIIGSACEAGELFQAVLLGKSDSEVARIVNFYDYLEIQPIGNNAFYLRDEKSRSKYKLETEEDLRNLNRRIVQLGMEFNKPVCATCDVHFLNPEDEIYRRIIMSNKGFDDSDMQPPLFLHTTDEMLEEFSYLGSEKAREVVITNPNMISDWCDRIQPTRPDKCPPVIENSDETLRKICYNRAHEMYGDKLPEIVEARLERELNSIISNGYAVMYIIAQKLVWKSNEDGYLVGSRGSVGSSFVATTAGITEVNPLSPHYICRKCHYVDFDSEEVKAFAGRAGCDMPDKKCPVCGEELYKDGFDIPFETFLGFKGDKEPDIDLNFSGDYQSKAHKYTEVIFGEGQTFKAGTIGTLADKTAYGYVKHYFEERDQIKRRCEIERILAGCVGVRRSTGQHPGGIIVLPVGEEIDTFTPVQHPANDMESDIITTHFDYHSIDSNLLKLDILGHQDPTMIRMLEDLTGLHAQEIPLDDPTVMSLFKDTSALGVEPEDLWNCDMGTLGIPEFGTDFAMGMLRDTKPKEFTDLIRIAGLAHGTDVWLGNAQTLIQEGKATISTAICTRDDIMTYLIGMGLDSEESFKIMEAVRKGMVAKGKADKWPGWKQDMIDHGVPDWYIWSCEKIKYMFPKAHAAAYVMMAWRVAYCKVFYPLAYYAAFFSIRATAFDYEKMCQGQDRCEAELLALDNKAKETKLSANEDALYRDLRIVQEMYARGYEFLPMDLYESDARYFKIVDGKLLPPLSMLGGMGPAAAENLAIAAAQATFLSKNDLKNRGKVSTTVIEKMDALGLIPNLPESDQLSLFDFQRV